MKEEKRQKNIGNTYIQTCMYEMKIKFNMRDVDEIASKKQKKKKKSTIYVVFTINK